MRSRARPFWSSNFWHSPSKMGLIWKNNGIQKSWVRQSVALATGKSNKWMLSRRHSSIMTLLIISSCRSAPASANTTKASMTKANTIRANMTIRALETLRNSTLQLWMTKIWMEKGQSFNGIQTRTPIPESRKSCMKTLIAPRRLRRTNQRMTFKERS